jgi:hypothetical protein
VTIAGVTANETDVVFNLVIVEAASLPIIAKHGEICRDGHVST